MPEKIRTGVIGAGWWSTDHHIPGCCPTLGPSWLRSAIRMRPPGRSCQGLQPQAHYPDYTAMLAHEALDAVFIVTPHATHYAIAKTAGVQPAPVHRKTDDAPCSRGARPGPPGQERQRQIGIGFAHLYYRTSIGRARSSPGADWAKSSTLIALFLRYVLLSRGQVSLKIHPCRSLRSIHLAKPITARVDGGRAWTPPDQPCFRLAV